MLAPRALACSALGRASRALSSATGLAFGVVGEGNQNTTMVATVARHSFTVDTPPEQGASPAQHLLGSLVGCQQAALASVAAERKVSLGTVRWAAEGTYSAESALPSLRGITATAQVDTTASQAVLDALRDEVLRRSLVAGTLRAAGVDLQLALRKQYNFKSSMGTYIDELVHESKRAA